MPAFDAAFSEKDMASHPALAAAGLKAQDGGTWMPLGD
jgi:hypothetical protein